MLLLFECMRHLSVCCKGHSCSAPCTAHNMRRVNLMRSLQPELLLVLQLVWCSRGSPCSACTAHGCPAAPAHLNVVVLAAPRLDLAHQRLDVAEPVDYRTLEQRGVAAIISPELN